MKNISFILKIIPLFLLVSSCGGGSASPPEPPVQVNQSPTVDAGVEQTVEVSQQVTLTASASDSDGTVDSFSWVQTSGTSVILNNADLISATFTSPSVAQDEILTFDITVTDNQGATATDGINIIVLTANQAPAVGAGNDQTYQEGQEVTIVSTSNDSDGEIVSYLWRQLSGVSAEMENENTFSLNFNAPLVDQDEVLIFEILVTDNDGATDSDTVSINVNANVSIITGTLNDTGITTCGDYGFDGGSRQNSNSEDCSEVIDGDADPIPAGQDGHLGFDASSNDDSNGHAGFNFTKLDENGNGLPASATEWSCVKDNITGFIWEVKSAVGGLQDGNNSYTWFNTNTLNNGGDNGTENGGSCAESNCDTSGYVVAINELGLCGGSDWEMPTLAQIRSIVDYSVLRPDPTIDADYFPNNTNDYWTSIPKGSAAWVLQFLDGSDLISSKNKKNSVRLVRQGQ